MPTRPSGESSRCCESQTRRVLDGVGHRRRNRVARQIRRPDGDDGMANGREIAGKADEARFVDSRSVHAGDEQERPSPGADWKIFAGRKGSASPGNRERLLDNWASLPFSERPRDPLKVGGLDHEGGAANVVACRPVASSTNNEGEDGNPGEGGCASTPSHAGG